MAEALKQEQTSTLVPLSQDHQAWLTSPALLNVFQFDYEQGNCRSGVNYTNTFTGCIEGAADRKETVDALVKWAKGDVTDTRNPLLRALVLNHPVLAEKVKEASSYPYIELREFVAKLIESLVPTVPISPAPATLEVEPTPGPSPSAPSLAATTEPDEPLSSES